MPKDHDDLHTTDRANARLRDRQTHPFDPSFKLVEALAKVERASANMVSAMNRVADGVYGRGGGGGGNPNFMSVLLWGSHARRESSNFWRDFFITGRRVGRNFWIADGHFRGAARPSPWERFSDRASDRAKVAMAAGSALADSALKAGSPASLRTLEKSWDLFQGKAASGLIRPTAKLAFALQDAAEWVGRQPEWAKDMAGWAGGLTIAGSATVVALGALSRSVKATAEAATWAAGLFRRTPVPNPFVSAAGGAAGQAAGSAAGSAVANTAQGAAGGAAAGGRFARFRSGAGRFAGWAWPVAAALDAYDTYENPESFVPKVISRAAPPAGPSINPGGIFMSPHSVAAEVSHLFGASREEADYFKQSLDWAASKMNPFADTKPEPVAPWVAKGTGGRGRANNIEFESNVRPAVMDIADVYRDATLRALEASPLDARINQARRENYQELVKEMQKANGHLENMATKDKATLKAR